ncbi:PREDICTED: agrin-like, partial [Amphimedon queenslandica]|uniref:EGF-like domain-containing protein n=2 Tax=Amphimedon queenslandica TaxID=400682 RepID=A0AAN0K1X5_AMPQE
MLQVSTPSFNRTSYQEYSSPAPISLTTSISLSFHPTSSNGLILYIGDVSTTRDFLSLSLVSGRIQLRYDLGSGVAIIASSSVIPLNQWTSVTVNRVRKDGILVVDGVSTNGSSPGFAGLLNPVGNLYIGGGAGGVGGYQVSPNAGSHVGLTGCVDTATLRVNSFGLGAVISSRGVIQCQVDPCSHSPCQNGGSCVSSDLTYSCVCPLGYSGDQCQE